MVSAVCCLLSGVLVFPGFNFFLIGLGLMKKFDPITRAQAAHGINSISFLWLLVQGKPGCL